MQSFARTRCARWSSGLACLLAAANALPLPSFTRVHFIAGQLAMRHERRRGSALPLTSSLSHRNMAIQRSTEPSFSCSSNLNPLLSAHFTFWSSVTALLPIFASLAASRGGCGHAARRHRQAHSADLSALSAAILHFRNRDGDTAVRALSVSCWRRSSRSSGRSSCGPTPQTRLTA